MSKTQSLITFLLLVAFHSGYADGNSNLILVTVDTLRADRLSCYGYSRNQTPNIDALGAQGARFASVVAQVPLTLPSHCSILTGTYPMFHQVRDNVGYSLDASKSTLAEVLKAQGYRTAAFVGAYVLSAKFGLNQGFDFYDDDFGKPARAGGIVNLNQLERPAAEVIRRAIQWVENNSSAPFFTWIHLYDPHDPYDPPAPFKARFAGRPYDGEVAYVDQQIGRLVEFLRSKDLYEDTVIALTSDHGESFGEHGEFTHGYFVYDSTLLVPLVIKPAGNFFKNVVVRPQVRTVDLMPTVLQMLGVAAPADLQGLSMLELIAGRSVGWPAEAYSETHYPEQFGWSSLRALRRLDTKYIEAPKPELFELSLDPAELKNRVSQNVAAADLLRKRLAEIQKEMYVSPTSPAVTLSGEDLRRLATLGYLGNIAPKARRSSSTPLSDPKDKLRIFSLISDAGRNAGARRYALAVQQLKEIVTLEPEMELAHFLLGDCYFQQKLYEPARQSFDRLLRLNAASLKGMFYLAACDFYLKRQDRAEAGFLEVLARDPQGFYSTDAHRYLGFIYQAREDTPRAILEFQKVLDVSSDDREAHSKLGFLLAKESRFAEAASHFRKAVELDVSNASAHFNLGQAYLKLNERQLAKVELQQACKLDERYCTLRP
jgi:arylsulfatase A-like enzyme/Flp pilus assembly protein TadD